MRGEITLYIHYCPAYEDIEVKVESTDAHINLSLRSIKSGDSVSATFNGAQVAVVASALIEILTAIGETEDPLKIFGGAVRIGGAVEIKRKEAA